MYRRRLLRALAGIVFPISLWAPFSLQADPLSRPEGLTPAESRGKIIYTTGQSPSGKPLFFRLLSAGEDFLPAKGVDCASCHGLDGKGGREGNVVIPDITYGALTKPLTASLPSARRRAPYTDVLLARAITQGLDSSGQQLGSLMPRWALPVSDLQDLLKYLERLGSK